MGLRILGLRVWVSAWGPRVSGLRGVEGLEFRA